MSAIRSALALLGGACVWTTFAGAQWAPYVAQSFPWTPDGEPDLSAPAPEAPNGRPDLSGVWLADADPEMQIVTVEHTQLPRYFVNITADLPPDGVKMQPWAEALFLERSRSRGLESPTAHCKPTGFPWLNTAPLPFKIVQTPDLIVVLYEENNVFRQIFLDGRERADDAVPRWMGYSVGTWEEDELVVETTGFNDRHWLDGMGHPHSDKLTVIERFRGTDAGHLEIEITIDDPGTYSRPITCAPKYSLVAQDDLLEYFCTENEKSAQHYR